jgi:tellurite resistance protein TehA-like permease
MFIISVIAFIVFIIYYIQGIMGLILTMEEFKDTDPNPILIFNTIFSPAVIISGVILGISSLVYRVLGIVHVARNKNVSDGEKALWIVGFIIMGFVTAIVFLIMAKGKKFVD